jgi:hypothetical protein
VLARKPFGVLVEELIELVRDGRCAWGACRSAARGHLDRGSAPITSSMCTPGRAAGGRREAAQAVVDWLIEETMLGAQRCGGV